MAASDSQSAIRNPQSAILGSLVAAIRSLATYIGISLYVLVCAPPGLVLAFAFGWSDVLYILGHGGVRLGLFLSGITCSVTGLEQVPQDRPVVFCANHQSNVDPPILFTLLHRRLHILFKAELLKLPLLGRVFVAGGFVPVKRESREQAMASIAAGAESLRAGNSFLIFPEGTRSRTNEMLPFKKGGFIMALTSQAPVIPVAIHGGREAMRKGSYLVWPARIRIRVGAAIETRGKTLQERDQLIAETRERIAAMLPGDTDR